MGYTNRICECTEIACKADRFHELRRKSGETRSGCANAPTVRVAPPDGVGGWVVCPDCAKTYQAKGWQIVVLKR
jgi:hypothetical protein